jgi:macrolide transport system ATP-binding/permease protein
LSQAIIELSGITKTYTMGDTVVRALNGVSLSIAQGDFVAIMGPSGSGKSTLMHLLGLLDVPNEGSYLLNSREVSGLSEDELAVARREEIGFIFQQFNLLPRMEAWENVSLPLLYSERALDATRAQALLAKVGLGTRVHHRSNELSGGQQQRVAIARALINRPRMVLADEPTGNLDSTSEKEIMDALRELNAQGITVIVVTHEEEIGAQAKRLIRMRDGVVQSDERREPLVAAGAIPALGSAVASGATGAAVPATLSAGGNSVGARELFEHFRQGYRTLAANKIRTGLSMLGILIGVAAVVAMLAIGKGAQNAIESQLASLGSNLLVLRPGAVRVGGVSQDAGATTRLTLADAASIADLVPQIREVAPGVNGRGQVTYLNRNWSTQITGASASYGKMHAAVPEIGRFFNNEENAKRARVAVIGATLVRELFGGKSPIGEMIKINRVMFQVVGVLPEKGANGWRDQDDIIIIPVLTAMHRLLGKEYVDSIELEARDPESIAPAQDAVIALMGERHRVPPSQADEAFQVRNMADIQAALSESSKTMSLLLASIAAISLLVGGIGIMNIMLVSVTERTKEIGLRKAVGARRRDILLQFLAESVLVSVIGGLIGIALGWSVTWLISSLSGWATVVSPESVSLAFFFSALIGIGFGIYPARKASQLHPIEALRYE